MPAALTLMMEKVATPPLAGAVRIPDKVPPAGFCPKLSVIVSDAVESMRPNESSTATVMAGLMAAPAATLVGWAIKANCVALGGLGEFGVVHPPTAPANGTHRRIAARP